MNILFPVGVDIFPCGCGLFVHCGCGHFVPCGVDILFPGDMDIFPCGFGKFLPVVLEILFSVGCGQIEGSISILCGRLFGRVLIQDLIFNQSTVV